MSMKRESIFNAWAPPTSIWTPWAKPVVFATMGEADHKNQKLMSMDPATPLEWVPSADGSTAVIIELPGSGSTCLGASLATKGFQPVPLFNGSPPAGSRIGAAVSTDMLVESLILLADDMANISLPAEAPPVFLLDSTRMGVPKAKLAPGMFDNRWVVLPQDFPSGAFLLAHRVTRVLIVRSAGRPIADDLNHVLYRWQKLGIELAEVQYDGVRVATPITIAKPRLFGSFLHRMAITMGLRHNSAGGFGAAVPYPSSSTTG